MNKKEALEQYFSANPAQVHLLELHRDGYTNKEKAAIRGCSEQNVKNKNTRIKRIFGVGSMDEAVGYAIRFGIIEYVPPQPPDINGLWSNALQDYHRKYLLSLSTVEKRARGCMW